MKAYLGFVISSWSNVSATCSTVIMFVKDYPWVTSSLLSIGSQLLQ